MLDCLLGSSCHVLLFSLFKVGGIASSDPLVDFRDLVAPEPADLLGGHAAFGDPLGDSFAAYTKVLLDFFGAKPLLD